MKNSRELGEELPPSVEIQLGLVFDSMLEGVCRHEIVYDDSGKPVNYKITSVNNAYEDILCLSRDKITGRLATDVYHVEQPLWSLNAWTQG